MIRLISLIVLERNITSHHWSSLPAKVKSLFFLIMVRRTGIFHQVHTRKRRFFSFMEPIRINNVQRGKNDLCLFLRLTFIVLSSIRDTALNLAAHRQKYHIVDLLLQYRANPNIPNQAGKTALHRAVVSYIDENANHIRTLLQVREAKREESERKPVAMF